MVFRLVFRILVLFETQNIRKIILAGMMGITSNEVLPHRILYQPLL